MPLPQLPVLCCVYCLSPQVEPFNVHVNPKIFHALTAYATPVPFEAGSTEALEAPFPNSVRAAAAAAPTTTTSWHSTDSGAPPSSLNTAEESLGRNGVRSPTFSGIREPSEFDQSAQPAAASMKFIASQVSIVLSSYPGGPAIIATTSHIFLQAIMRPPGGGDGSVRWASQGRECGDEVFARLSRVSCSVDCGHGGPLSSPQNKNAVWGGGPRRPDLQGGDAVLKPFDVDIHLTRPQANSANDCGGNNSGSVDSTGESSSLAPGWHAAIYIDELYLRVGATHTHSLERLAGLFIPAVAAAESTAAKLARGPGSPRTVAGARGGGPTHADDLFVLERVESFEYVGRGAAVKPRPGQAVFYGIDALQSDAREEKIDASAGDGNGSNDEEDGWVTCCEWQYWGLRRVAQIALPCAPVVGGVPLVDGLVVDSLEVELSFVDPLTGNFKVRRCDWFEVSCLFLSAAAVAFMWPVFRFNRCSSDGVENRFGTESSTVLYASPFLYQARSVSFTFVSLTEVRRQNYKITKTAKSGKRVWRRRLVVGVGRVTRRNCPARGLNQHYLYED